MRLIDADALMESIRKALGIKSMAKSLLLPAERTIIDQIDSAQTVGGWISVKDRLPEEDGLYNVYCKDGSMAHAWFEDKWFIDHCECGYGYVTHWMPLLEAPKEETDNA